MEQETTLAPIYSFADRPPWGLRIRALYFSPSSSSSSATASTITSTELNFLVFRCLRESDRCLLSSISVVLLSRSSRIRCSIFSIRRQGLIHASFVLGYEAGIYKSSIDGNLVPPAALITLVQKGLQYVEMEANLDNNDVDCEDDFSLFQPLDLITKSVDELQRMVKAKKKENIQKEFDKIKDNVHAQKQEKFEGETSRGRQKKDGDQEENKGKMDVDDDQGKVKERVMKMEKKHSQSKVKSSLRKHKVSRGLLDN